MEKKFSINGLGWLVVSYSEKGITGLRADRWGKETYWFPRQHIRVDFEYRGNSYFVVIEMGDGGEPELRRDDVPMLW